MHNSHDPKVLPVRDGVSPSCVVLPQQAQGLLIDFLSERLSTSAALPGCCALRLVRW